MVNPISREIARRRTQHAYTQGTGPGGMWYAGPAAPGPLAPYNPNAQPPMPPQRPSEAAPPPPQFARQPGWINRVAQDRRGIDLSGIAELEAGAQGNRLALARIYDFINSPAARKLTPEQWAVINGKARELRERIRANQRMPRPDARRGVVPPSYTNTMQRGESGYTLSDRPVTIG